MKTLLTVITLVFASMVSSNEASAAQCTFELQNGRGRLLQTFQGWGYSRGEACRDAINSCRRVKDARYYRAPIQRCVESRLTPRPRPRRPIPRPAPRPRVEQKCKAKLTGPLGFGTVKTFERFSWSKRAACDIALNACFDYQRVVNLGGYCKISDSSY